MVKFQAELPTELIKTFEMIGANAQKMLADMTKAGAEVVYVNILAEVPDSFRDSDIMNCLHVTRAYVTPSDDGINTKVAFYGYFINKRGVETPAELVCNLYEYGCSTDDFPKHPFIRKAFRKDQIEAAMLKVQSKYIPEE